MSKLAKKPIQLTEDISASLSGDFIVLKGKSGELKAPKLSGLEITVDNTAHTIVLKNISIDKQARANLGTLASLLKNSLLGLQRPLVLNRSSRRH